MTSKKNYFILIVCLTSQCGSLFSQQFKTTFFAQSDANIDSIEIGYDPLASIEIDPQFGEIDINQTEFNTPFEIRVGQLNLNYFDCGANINDTKNPFLSYMSKIDILPKDCSGWELNQTINGNIPYSTLLVRNKDMPIELSWDSLVFEDSCLSKSVITDWNPEFWFDVSCGSLNIYPYSLKENSSLTLSEETEMYLIDGWGDTISMFYIVLQNNDEILNTNEIRDKAVVVYPNPTSDLVTIVSNENKIDLLEVYNSVGELIKTNENPKVVSLNDQPEGFYYFKLISKNTQEINRIVIKRS